MGEHLSPVDAPIYCLEVQGAFEKLTEQEKKYAHFLAQGIVTYVRVNLV